MYPFVGVDNPVSSSWLPGLMSSSKADPSTRSGMANRGRPDAVAAGAADDGEMEEALLLVALPDPPPLEHEANTSPAAAPPPSPSSRRREIAWSARTRGGTAEGSGLISALVGLRSLLSAVPTRPGMDRQSEKPLRRLRVVVGDHENPLRIEPHRSRGRTRPLTPCVDCRPGRATDRATMNSASKQTSIYV